MESKEKKDEIQEKEEIKSTAIVKYSVPNPAQFMKLKCNTDLNLPPSNWLSSSADSYGLQHVLYHQKGFSSFRMANMFPDCVGEVDVVSDAENIKNLLKIPYCKGHISMMVHRIENTLLLDDFDIYKYLLKTSETEWKWLKNFFFENINHKTYEEDRNLYIKNRRREALKQKSLVSKFLYYSLVENKNNDQHFEMKHTRPMSLEGPLLPDPAPTTPDPSDHKYNRNVVWTFEDIEMLIGTDLPIFGGGTHPCISLRLRDMSQPINVLTGIDYWLDNLMSNVPEVLMCYHLNGIVQKYELIKTEDLPRLNNSKFSPNLIRDVAQSILSFLKSNATKAGHTYWLFKGKDEEVAKLYDLTSLCHDKDVENPFTVPVAMLLYKVARNMKNSMESQQLGTIKMLLKNCIKLLSEEKYAEIVISSHYMLSDLYVPIGTNPENPVFNQISDNDQMYNEEFPNDCQTKILLLSEKYDKFIKHNQAKTPPVNINLEERCQQALQHVIMGLNCLKYCLEKKEKVDCIPMANPNEPIPMGSSTDDKPKTTTKVLLKNDNQNTLSWKIHLKILLYEKALLIYAILSEYYFVVGQYGNCLKTTGFMARCQLILTKLFTSNLKMDCLLRRAGDCCIMVVQNWSKVDVYREEYQNFGDEDMKMMEQFEKDEQLYNINLGESCMKYIFIYDILTIEQILLQSVDCYQIALSYSDKDAEICLRLGNSLNEVASLYISKAKSSKSYDTVVELCKKAEVYLKRGLDVFLQIKDNSNMALLYMNMGHLHRVLVQFNGIIKDRNELMPKEKFHYNKAFINYKKALQVLGDRRNSPGIWDAVKWELSTAFFNMATTMHEFPSASLTRAEAEKEVIETLQKALQYCDLDEENPKFPLYQYRAATIHFRIASLYHSHIWNSTDPNNRKYIIQLAKINYEKATMFYFASLDVIMYLKSQMQRLALSEYLAETTKAPNNKIKHLQNCVEILLEVKHMLQLLIEKKIEISESEKTNNDAENKGETFKSCHSLLHLIKQRLQHNLKILIKLCLMKPIPNKDCPKLVEVYKDCYKLTFTLKDDANFEDLLRKLNDVLVKITVKILDLNRFVL